MLLTSNVYQFSRFRGTGIWGANIFLLVNESLTLVDTGFRGRHPHILKEIAKLGYSPSNINRILITHHHPDHSGSLAVMKQLTGARVLAHPADTPYINGSLPQPGPSRPDWAVEKLAPFQGLWATVPAVVDELVNDGDELPILGGIQVIHTPGHTPGSISLLLKKKRWLLVGDVLSHTLGLSLPSRAFTVNVEKEISSLKKLLNLDFDSIAFGHGMPIVGKAKPALIDFVNRVEKKRARNR